MSIPGLGDIITRKQCGGASAMNLSELCIRRPIMTVLLSASAVVAGIIAYGGLPIAALPSYDSPTISVNGNTAGRKPGNHGLLSGHSTGTSIFRYFWSFGHQFDQHAWQHLHYAGV